LPAVAALLGSGQVQPFAQKIEKSDARIIEFATQLRQLKELLPICMYCKKIRDDENYWHAVESYISQQTGSNFSHGICPECFEKHVKFRRPQAAT